MNATTSCALLSISFVFAAPSFAAPSERYVVEIRVIEASPGSGSDAKQTVDDDLSSLAKDLKSLPFSSFKLVDNHRNALRSGESVSLEIPGKKKRFLVVAAHGRQKGNKLRFGLEIEALDFETLVAVPDGGTIIVGGPKNKKGKSLVFALTAKAQK